MHKIERLLQTLVPKGVEFRKLGEVLEYDQPNKYCVTSKEFDKSYPTPVLTAGKTFILGYTNEKDNIYQASKSYPVIIFDDFTTATQWVDFPFKVKSSAMKILFSKNPIINIRFIFFYMQTIPYNIGGEHARHWISRYSQLEVPIPPLEIQQEIVKILDAFTELNTELNTELKARKKQYQYYQNMLLDFNDINQNHKDAKMSAKPYPKRLKTLLQTLVPKGVEFRKLGEVCEITRGKRVTKKEILDKGKYPVVSCGIGFMGYLNEYNREENTITIAQYGTAGFVNWQNQKFWANDACFSLIPNETLINRYLYYVLTNMQNYLYSISNRNAIHYNISSNNIMQITIPIPPLEIQQEIVKILDQFSLLTTDLLAGIPAEIKARKKQYEYYREKLLTFKPLTPNKEVDKE
ncbi:restriction endonuclease subunit S [Helicobacter pylori]|uniref:restriction endonuclease subunit S n=1 Tax=Helicobacter pylori TaxID=210 RepID=UPI000D35BCB2|nr:restriction endonuclease subunit S [Helicobacter pylori]PUD08151.1 restriction endonuclease subunit S [Helicobacter pylori]WQX19727.1 restriction endonuclease subunit S [Helicobacter pylori]